VVEVEVKCRGLLSIPGLGALVSSASSHPRSISSTDRALCVIQATRSDSFAVCAVLSKDAFKMSADFAFVAETEPQKYAFARSRVDTIASSSSPASCSQSGRQPRVPHAAGGASVHERRRR
jgi:hypothetical protein